MAGLPFVAGWFAGPAASQLATLGKWEARSIRAMTVPPGAAGSSGDARGGPATPPHAAPPYSAVCRGRRPARRLEGAVRPSFRSSCPSWESARVHSRPGRFRPGHVPGAGRGPGRRFGARGTGGAGGLFGPNITLTGGPAPVRAYIDELPPAVLDGTVQPGRVFDRTVSLDKVPDGYRAMDQREALKVLVRP
ncbi:hypothetical protein GCM10022245_00470 [Streptomyces mayteni]